MQAYLVGGAVRDNLLKLPSKDKDWVIVGATPDEMLEKGFTQVGQDFPVFLHPDSHEEFALARTERKQGKGYTGFVCDSSASVTLEEDLIRRDLTINAMAQAEDGSLIDPYGGQNDLKNKILRHVSPAFVEDPLRVLRVARFAARFQTLGFKIAPETLQLMSTITANGELDHLVAERVCQETTRALSEASPQAYFEVLRNVGALKVLFPEVDALFGIPQPEKHHPEIDCGIHTLMVLEQASKLSSDPAVRFASLTHDLGKALTPAENWPHHYGHEKLGLKAIKTLCKRTRMPNSFRELSLLVSEYHTHIHKALELKPATALKVLKQCDAYRKPERFEAILICAKADSRGRTGFEEVPYLQANYFSELLKVTRTIQAKQFLEQGFQGKELGEKIDQARKNIFPFGISTKNRLI